MSLTTQIATHIREVHFGKNWTESTLKEHLSDVTWQQATQQVYTFNTIAALVYHMNYYVQAVLKVLEGKTLDSKDINSFAHPAITSEEDWKKLLDNTWKDAENLATLVEQMPEARLWDDFKDNKYGNFYRNIHGVIEHIHYHLGQVVLIKKIIMEK